MKKYAFFIIVIITTLTSCSLDDGNSEDFFLEVLPIESVDIPEQFVQGETYEIFMTYTKPSPCYVFNNIIFDIEGYERTVAIVNTVYPNGNCNENAEEVTVSFDLTVSGIETYLFKFFQGEDAQGVDQYHLIEVPVVDGRFHNR